MYLSLHCHHQNDSCIKVGSDESHFNVSLTARDKVTGQHHVYLLGGPGGGGGDLHLRLPQIRGLITSAHFLKLSVRANSNFKYK